MLSNSWCVVVCLYHETPITMPDAHAYARARVPSARNLPVHHVGTSRTAAAGRVTYSATIVVPCRNEANAVRGDKYSPFASKTNDGPEQAKMILSLAACIHASLSCVPNNNDKESVQNVGGT